MCNEESDLIVLMSESLLGLLPILLVLSCTSSFHVFFYSYRKCFKISNTFLSVK